VVLSIKLWAQVKMQALAVLKLIGVVLQMLHNKKMSEKIFIKQHTYATPWQYKQCHGKLA